MISHCANPDCRRPFHYLRGGRLYRFDIRHPSSPCSDVPNAICNTKPSHAAVFFWLCEHCSSQYSLRFNIRTGISLIPPTDSARKLSTAPVIAVEDVEDATRGGHGAECRRASVT
jgi:hypothetical protein